MFLVTLYLYNNIQEVLFTLQESNFTLFKKLFSQTVQNHHFGQWLSQWAEFRTSVASRLVSLFVKVSTTNTIVPQRVIWICLSIRSINLHNIGFHQLSHELRCQSCPHCWPELHGPGALSFNQMGQGHKAWITRDGGTEPELHGTGELSLN